MYDRRDLNKFKRVYSHTLRQ